MTDYVFSLATATSTLASQDRSVGIVSDMLLAGWPGFDSGPVGSGGSLSGV
jgi:hypothetical protein